MKNTILLLSFFIINISFSQNNDILEFSECYVSQRQHTDSNFLSSTYFSGVGTIEIHEDSIIVEFGNEWECGKYLMYISSSEQFKDGDEIITHFSGKFEYYGWSFDFFLIRSSTMKAKAVILDTEFVELNSQFFATRRRFYPMNSYDNKRRIVNSFD